MSPSLSKIYIGSTIQTLKKRLWLHKNRVVDTCTSKIIIEAGDYTIFTIEEIKYNDRKELLLKEGEWINAMKNSGMLVNKSIAGRTKADWYRDNKELTLARSKKRVEDNRETIREYHKRYYQERKKKVSTI